MGKHTRQCQAGRGTGPKGNVGLRRFQTNVANSAPSLFLSNHSSSFNQSILLFQPLAFIHDSRSIIFVPLLQSLQAHSYLNKIRPPMMRQSFAILVCVFAALVAADPLDDAIALMKRQNDNNSTSVPPTSSAETSSRTTIRETSTFTPSPSVSTFTSFSTFTPTNSQGSTTASEVSSEVITSSAAFTQVETSATQEVITTITSVSDGSTILATRTSSTVVPTTTSVDPATLNNGKSGGGSSGLSSSTKAIIGGVVGGVGGALLLGGLAYTAWRIWGKKKNLHDDDLYDPNQNREKLSTSTDNQSTPFRNNLERYHQPGPVNTASNF